MLATVGFLIQKWRGDLAHRTYARPENRRTPYQQRVYGSFSNPSRLPREEYNDGNYQGVANGGETDDDDGRPVIATTHTRLDEVGDWGRSERISHRNGYELHRRADFNNSPRGTPRVPHHSTPWLAKMDSYSGQGSESLEGFFDQVEEYTAFYSWDGQARALLNNTALSYVKHAPFAHHSWEELKALLLKRFQPRDLTATYKAQFCSRR